jgi:uncharacterized membrane protein
MQGRAKFLGHSIHPALIVLPMGLLLLVAPFDLVYLITRDPFWGRMSFWLCSLGILGGLLAAIPGFIDFLSVPRRTRAYRITLYHLFVQVTALGFFIFSWFTREFGDVNPRASAFILSLSGFIVILIGGWLGGELVQQHGVAVRREAHLDAPSSLDADRLVRRSHKPTPPFPQEPQPA